MKPGDVLQRSRQHQQGGRGLAAAGSHGNGSVPKGGLPKGDPRTLPWGPTLDVALACDPLSRG